MYDKFVDFYNDYFKSNTNSDFYLIDFYLIDDVKV